MLLSMLKRENKQKEELIENTDDFKQPDVCINKLLNIEEWENVLMLDNLDESYSNSVKKLDNVISNTKFKELENVIDQVSEIFPKFYCPHYSKPRLDAISKYVQEKSYVPFTIMPAKTLEKYIELYMNEVDYGYELSNKYGMVGMVCFTILFSKIFL